MSELISSVGMDREIELAELTAESDQLLKIAGSMCNVVRLGYTVANGSRHELRQTVQSKIHSNLPEPYDYYIEPPLFPDDVLGSQWFRDNIDDPFLSSSTLSYVGSNQDDDREVFLPPLNGESDEEGGAIVDYLYNLIRPEEADLNDDQRLARLVNWMLAELDEDCEVYMDLYCPSYRLIDRTEHLSEEMKSLMVIGGFGIAEVSRHYILQAAKGATDLSAGETSLRFLLRGIYQDGQRSDQCVFIDLTNNFAYVDDEVEVEASGDVYDFNPLLVSNLTKQIKLWRDEVIL